MNNICFNDMPIEIKNNVFEYISAKEKKFIIPFVCKKWCGATFENRHIHTNQLFLEATKYCNTHENNFATKYKSIIFKMIKNNELIPEVVNNNYEFGLLHSKNSISYKDTSPFFIYWNQKKLKPEINKKGGWGDIRGNYYLKMNIQNDKSKIFEIFLDLHSTMLYPDQGNFFEWKPMLSYSSKLSAEEKSFFELCEHVSKFVRDIFNFEISNHVDRLAEGNLSKLLDLAVTELPVKLLFDCDDFGRISKKKDPSYPWENYSAGKLIDVSQHLCINFKGLENKKPYIHSWSTEGLNYLSNAVSSFNYSVKHILKCCVLSKTVSLLSKRIDFLANL